jgi:hypothetical protein
VGRAPVRGLEDLRREGEQAPDQLALGGLQRQAVARRGERGGSTRSSPALRSIEAIRACAYCT